MLLVAFFNLSIRFLALSFTSPTVLPMKAALCAARNSLHASRDGVAESPVRLKCLRTISFCSSVNFVLNFLVAGHSGSAKGLFRPCGLSSISPFSDVVWERNGQC